MIQGGSTGFKEGNSLQAKGETHTHTHTHTREIERERERRKGRERNKGRQREEGRRKERRNEGKWESKKGKKEGNTLAITRGPTSKGGNAI